MILDEKVTINIGSRNKAHYKKLGYDISQKQITVKTTELLRNSNVIVNVEE